MSVDLSSHVHTPIWLLCISQSHGRGIKVLAPKYFKNRSWGGHKVDIYVVWLWGDISYTSGYASSPMLLSNGSTLKKIDKGYTSVYFG
jgi:hypothetical protein